MGLIFMIGMTSMGCFSFYILWTKSLIFYERVASLSLSFLTLHNKVKLLGLTVSLNCLFCMFLINKKKAYFSKIITTTLIRQKTL